MPNWAPVDTTRFHRRIWTPGEVAALAAAGIHVPDPETTAAADARARLRGLRLAGDVIAVVPDSVDGARVERDADGVHLVEARQVGAPARDARLALGQRRLHTRRRGLGRWLKATMLDLVLRERQQVTRVRTSNAYSNESMLRINEALGFRQLRTETEWQVATERAREYLTSSKGSL